MDGTQNYAFIGMVSIHATAITWWRPAFRRNKASKLCLNHYGDVMMGAIASQITSLTIFYSTVYSDADQRKHQSSVSLAFVRGIHRWPVNSPHKGPITRKMFPFHDVIILNMILDEKSDYSRKLSICMWKPHGRTLVFFSWEKSGTIYQRIPSKAPGNVMPRISRVKITT